MLSVQPESISNYDLKGAILGCARPPILTVKHNMTNAGFIGRNCPHVRCAIYQFRIIRRSTMRNHELSHLHEIRRRKRKRLQIVEHLFSLAPLID